ncbi:MAG TPA: hypothetical protein PKD00_03940 [Burkholderiales bacterium]|nr:hypothetical protein [Burkholderiales bacterium]
MENENKEEKKETNDRSQALSASLARIILTTAIGAPNGGERFNPLTGNRENFDTWSSAASHVLERCWAEMSRNPGTYLTDGKVNTAAVRKLVELSTDQYYTLVRLFAETNSAVVEALLKIAKNT